MCMKGHNGLYPCRFCKIRGIRVPDTNSPAHYIPLDRTSHPAPGDVSRYDAADLPMRTHREMLEQAFAVDNAENPTRAQQLGRDSGMNGMPILAALPSIRLDRSFPIEFMHLVWLNLIPNLVLLYTGNYKNLDAGIGEYELLERVWEEIGRITARAGSNIPNAFGARVPDPAKDKSHMIAETWCLWTMFIAPVVLRGRFVDDKYYDHFMQLVGLLELTPEYVQAAFFGQLQHVFVLSLPALKKFKQREPQTVLLASVKDCTGATDAYGNGIQYYSGALGPSHIIDLAAIECLVGRIEDRGEWAIVDRSNDLTRVLVPNDDEDAE
ncbi:hypothetical protein EXIGLDRAFT_713006 [Exidia glandulosa HHB12029]|uniref:Uncharacterized protein n=1 Tax=Exidia glandulosa HHB12029 TaxID=1314781 RepID=A0A165D466_EXIGL|nr:hypothetical protein EXIGLDRAFT_713006 [Exidia glandulosa HHB12029]